MLSKTAVAVNGVGLAVLLAGVLLLAGPGSAGVLDASWTAPTTNSDGSPLADLAFYRVYYGTSSRPCPGSTFVQVPSSTPSPLPNQTVTVTLTGLSAGTRYYVSVTAVDASGNESACTNQPQAVAARTDSPLSAFVARLYGDVLARPADSTGLALWTNYLGVNCNAQGFATISRGFFDSQEFRTNRSLGLTDLVRVLYRTFLNRDPDPAGLAGWTEFFRQTRLGIALHGFLPSAEFQRLVPNRRNPTAVAAVVTRLYQEILQRNPDQAGLAGWVNYVVTTGDVEGMALSFLASQEFDSRRLTFRDYVTILYRALLGRAPDAGLDGWEAILRDSLLRAVDAGFVRSPEFQGLIPQVCR